MFLPLKCFVILALFADLIVLVICIIRLGSYIQRGIETGTLWNPLKKMRQSKFLLRSFASIGDTIHFLKKFEYAASKKSVS